MSDSRLRGLIARRAAQLMYSREESEYFTAKRKAAREFGVDGRTRDLPANREIREQIRILADLYEGEQRLADLRDMRVDALDLMRRLATYHPRLIGSVLTGHVRKGSDIDIHVFTDDPSGLAMLLEDEGYSCEVEHKRIEKHTELRVFTHIHVKARFPYELTVYAADKVNYPFKSSITGKAIEKADAAALETLLRSEYPDLDIEAEIGRVSDQMDVFELYRLLLLPLESVKQSPTHHPEGDALFHSLQVFELATRERPWDQEFLIAALMHDVGKAIDRQDHVNAAIEALDGAITERTAFLIGNHMTAHAYQDGTLGARAKRRLRESEDLADLLLLQELDHRGRVPGAAVPTVEQAIAYLRELEQM